MKPVGYFNVSRSVFNNPIFEEEPMTQREAWMWLIASAAYEPTRVRVNNGRSFEIINLRRGQLSFSLSFLRTAWKWTSEKKVRTFLERLQREGLIDRQRGNQTDGKRSKFPPVITVCNYNVYPFAQPIEETSKEPQGAVKGRSKGDQTGNESGNRTPLQALEIKEVLKLAAPKRAIKGQSNGQEEEEFKKESALDEGFDDWYAVYPRKKSRADAQRAFAKTTSLIALPALMEKTKAFAAGWKDKPEAERKFIPYPASWLNKGGYDDEPDVKPALTAGDPRTFSDAKWQKILTYAQENGWSPGFGPEPGLPGCLVPSHLLIARVSRGAA
jgi:hypothetical protein